MICRFCGREVAPDDLLHGLSCDGRQGHIEAEAEPEDDRDHLAPVVDEITDAIDAWKPRDEPVLRARGSDPETSHQAMAAYDRERMRSAIDCVVQLYRDRGPMADYELREAFAAAWDAPCCDHLYQQARSAARDKGLIVDTGDRRVNPQSGRRQVVWAFSAGAPVVIDRCESCGHVLRRRKENEGAT